MIAVFAGTIAECVLLYLVWVALRTRHALNLGSSIISTFTWLARSALLIPVGIPVFLASSVWLPFPMPTALGLACFVPSMLLASRLNKYLQRQGTDRVRPAQAFADRIFVLSLASALFLGALSAFAFGLSVMHFGV